MYGLLYGMQRRRVLGMRLSTLACRLPILALLLGLLLRWPTPLLVALAIVSVWFNFSFWRARRDNFNRFVPQSAPAPDTDEVMLLAPNRKMAVRATGLFSVSGRTSSLLLRPAQYWRVPLGDHVVMAEEAPGKYLYQFFDARSLQEVRPGWLLFGAQPIESLAITFLARWGPEYTRFGPEHERPDGEQPPAKRLTIYLSPEDEAARQTIERTIVDDARQARLNV
jgi:hypothetical protein